MNTYQDHPKDGVAGLKEHYTSDAISGFIVFLLALPLSLGIAKASEFPPLMGLLTAIIGGLLVSLLAGSPLTIKGPAAGLIVIILGAVNEFGGGELGWRLSLGAIVVAGFIQVLFGLFKWGKLVDFFPLSAVHGMLAAIGMIIMLKQFPVMLNVDPAMAKGKSPFELMRLIPDFIQHLDRNGSIVGLLSLGIMLLWPQLPLGALKKIPAALVVLTIAIPAELLLDFKHTEPASALVHVGDFLQSLKINVSFEGLHQTGTFIKYVVMFALVGSLESLLTVKAIDLMDPYKRKSNTNKDLIAVGLGNMVAGFLGWEVLGISSFLLISFYRERYLPSKNAVKIFSIYRIGDVGILLAMWLSHHLWHANITFQQLAEAAAVQAHLREHSWIGVIISLMILLAAIAKSAQFPFSSWLPRAMEGPTPSSAIFYGSLSVHMGLFLMIRTFPFWKY